MGLPERIGLSRAGAWSGAKNRTQGVYVGRVDLRGHRWSGAQSVPSGAEERSNSLPALLGRRCSRSSDAATIGAGVIVVWKLWIDLLVSLDRTVVVWFVGTGISVKLCLWDFM